MQRKRVWCRNCTKYLTRLTPRTRDQVGVVILSVAYDNIVRKTLKRPFSCLSVTSLLSKDLAQVIIFPRFVLWHVSPSYAVDFIMGWHCLDEPIWFPRLPNVRGVLFEVCFSLKATFTWCLAGYRNPLQTLLMCFWRICFYSFNNIAFSIF